MSDLYRIDEDRLASLTDYHRDHVRSKLNSVMFDEVLVPVVPCEHGKYDRHPRSYQEYSSDQRGWCPGAALGGNDGVV